MTPEEKKQLQDLTDAQKTLSEKVSGLEGENKRLSDENASLKADAATAAKKASFDKLLAEGKAVEAQREPYMAGDMVKYAELAGQPENRQAQGHGKEPVKETKELSDMTPEQAEDKICELADAKAKAENISLDAAMKIVLSENPKLAELQQKKFGF